MEGLTKNQSEKEISNAMLSESNVTTGSSTQRGKGGNGVTSDEIKIMESKLKTKENICQDCHSKFKLFHKRYNCKFCKSSFCKNCIQKKKLIISQEKQQVLICNSCLDKYQQMQVEMDQSKALLARNNQYNKNYDENMNKHIDISEDDTEYQVMLSKKEYDEMKSLGHKQASIRLTRQSTINQNAMMKFIQKQNEGRTDQSQKTQDRFTKEGKMIDHQLTQYMRVHLNEMIVRVIEKYNINKDKWAKKLRHYTLEAVLNIKPSSRLLKDSIDFTKFVKILLVEYENQDKCENVDGIVIMKNIAHKQMRREIKKPKILIMSNSMGYISDDNSYFDIDSEIQQQEKQNLIIRQKLDMYNPDMIIVEKDVSRSIIDMMQEKNMTLVQNVKQQVIKRIARLTQTILCPDIYLLNESFVFGKCQKFRVEQIQSSRVQNGRIVKGPLIDLMYIQGCQPSLGCTIVLSDPDIEELKVIKKALKEMLKLARIITLEKEYLYFMRAQLMPQPIPKEPRTGFDLESQSSETQQQMERANASEISMTSEQHENKSMMSTSSFAASNNQSAIDNTLDTTKNQLNSDYSKDLIYTDRNTPFLIQKHFERDQLSFLHMTFSRQHSQTDDANTGDQEHPEQFNRSEAQIRTKLKQLCINPQTVKVNFYNENQDISLINQMKKMAFDTTKACNKCKQYYLRHIICYFHMNGHVQIQFKTETNNNNDIDVLAAKLKNQKDIYMHCFCLVCKDRVIGQRQLNNEVMEMSFYSFLEQIFYNQDLITRHQNSKCKHSMHRDFAIIFKFGPLKIMMNFIPQSVYTLDMVYFKTLKGEITQDAKRNKMDQTIWSLDSDIKNVAQFFIKSIDDHERLIDQYIHFDISIFKYMNAQIMQDLKQLFNELKDDIQMYKDLALKVINKTEFQNQMQIYSFQMNLSVRICDWVVLMKAINNSLMVGIVKPLKEKKLNLQVDKNNPQATQIGADMNAMMLATNNTVGQASILNQLENQVPMTGKDNNTFKKSPFEKYTPVYLDTAQTTGYTEMNNNEVDISANFKGLSTQDQMSAKDSNGTQKTAKGEANFKIDAIQDQLENFVTQVQQSQGNQISMQKITSNMTESTALDKKQSIKASVGGQFLANQINPYIQAVQNFQEHMYAKKELQNLTEIAPQYPKGFNKNQIKINPNDLTSIIAACVNSCFYVQGLFEIQYMNIRNKLKRQDANKTNEMFKNEYMNQDDSITPQNFSNGKKGFMQQSNAGGQNATGDNHQNHMDNAMNIRASMTEAKNQNNANHGGKDLRQSQSFLEVNQNNKAYQHFDNDTETLSMSQPNDVLNNEPTPQETEEELCKHNKKSFRFRFNNYSAPKNQIFQILDQQENEQSINKQVEINTESFPRAEIDIIKQDIDQDFYDQINNIIHQINDLKDKEKMLKKVTSDRMMQSNKANQGQLYSGLQGTAFAGEDYKKVGGTMKEINTSGQKGRKMSISKSSSDLKLKHQITGQQAAVQSQQHTKDSQMNETMESEQLFYGKMANSNNPNMSLASRELPQVHQINTKGKEKSKLILNYVKREDLYEQPAYFHGKQEYQVKMYFPGHFEILRRLYTGSHLNFLQSIIQSKKWTTTAGKAGAAFFKSHDDKYIIKDIKPGEMQHFVEMGKEYFEYMNKSFNFKYLSCLGKILGAFKISVNHKQNHKWYIVLMENLFVNWDMSQSKNYDLKGSKINRYIVRNNESDFGLDNNFLLDNESRPIALDYITKRLLQITIINDSLFLSQHQCIDYSIGVLINHESKLVRVGIFDYLQPWSFDKQIENKYKQARNGGEDPTIIPPEKYGKRFKDAMEMYFVGMMTDKDISGVEKALKKMKMHGADEGTLDEGSMVESSQNSSSLIDESSFDSQEVNYMKATRPKA